MNAKRAWTPARTLALAAAMILAGAAHAGTITLRPSARVDVETPLTLAEIATLEGDEAHALANTTILESVAAEARGRAWIEIGLADVREALNDAGVNWGRLALRGRACVARLALPAATEASPDADSDERETMGPVDLSGPATVRRSVAATLARHFGVEPADMRLRFSGADRETLDRRVNAQRLEVQPMGLGGVTPVRIRLYEGERITLERSMRVEAQVRRVGVVPTADLPRDELLAPEVLETADLWLDPAQRIVGSLDDAIGKRTRRRVDAGEALTPDALESPIVVRRGEVIPVRCLSGGIVLTARARAVDDARAGERVELRLDGSERAFIATIDERGLAIVNLDAPQSRPAPDLRGDRR